MSGPVVFALRLLLTASLYGFLAWALFTLWRDLKLQGALLASRRVPPISLTIHQGEHPALTRRYIQAEVTIGRDPTCECLLEDEAVSARHARLSYHHNQWWLEDLNSTNGTLLNQEKLALPTVITAGDEFRCGDSRIDISLQSDTLTQPARKK